jgi:hypothetical protein
MMQDPRELQKSIKVSIYTKIAQGSGENTTFRDMGERTFAIDFRTRLRPSKVPEMGKMIET